MGRKGKHQTEPDRGSWDCMLWQLGFRFMGLQEVWWLLAINFLRLCWQYHVIIMPIAQYPFKRFRIPYRSYSGQYRLKGSTRAPVVTGLPPKSCQGHVSQTVRPPAAKSNRRSELRTSEEARIPPLGRPLVQLTDTAVRVSGPLAPA